jgi:hypothetical protein
MLDDPDSPLVLQEMEPAAGGSPGALHDFFEHLQQVRWLTCESVVTGLATDQGRAVARSYRISDLGIREASLALERLERA